MLIILWTLQHILWTFYYRSDLLQLKENFSLINYIFLHFALIGLEWDSITLFTKMNFFSSKTHISAPFTQDIYMTFYLLTWTYFNDVNGGRNILINSQLKRILFMSSDKKKWNKTEKDRKNMEKENNSDESDFSENEIPD